MKRPQLTYILGAKKNSGGITSHRSGGQRGVQKSQRTGNYVLVYIYKDKSGKSTEVSLQFSRTGLLYGDVDFVWGCAGFKERQIFKKETDEMIRKSELHT